MLCLPVCLSGATLSKGVNRGIGTVIGGGFGLATAVIAEDAGEMGNAIGVAIAVFVCGKYETISLGIA